VSLLWPERLRNTARRLRETSRRLNAWQLRVGLAPDRLLVAAYRGRLRRALAATETVAVGGGGDLPPWRAAVDALPAVLERHASGKPRTTVVLSSHFVRYALLPPDPALRTAEEWAAYARHRMESVHGHAVADWDLRVAETGKGGPRLACGVDRALLEALNGRVAEARATLVSVQPYLMAAFNRARPSLGGRSCWLVIAEPGRLVLALIRNGAWHSIRCRNADEGWQRRLPEILARESAALALAQPCADVVVMTPEALDADLPGDLRILDLTLPRGASEAHQPLAMVLP
jgi:hypothetical protein